MNALDRNFVNVGTRAAAARFLGGAAIAALLAGCAGMASTKIDPSSPVAADVANLARADADYPSFREIPAAPTDVTPPRVYARRAAAVNAAAAQLDQATAPNTWTLSNSETFAARARKDAGPDLTPAPNTDTEGFAASSRKRATPPPPRQ